MFDALQGGCYDGTGHTRNPPTPHSDISTHTYTGTQLFANWAFFP